MRGNSGTGVLGIVHGIGDEVGSDSARDIVVRLGGTAALEQAFVAVAFAMLGMVAAAFAALLLLASAELITAVCCCRTSCRPTCPMSAARIG